MAEVETGLWNRWTWAQGEQLADHLNLLPHLQKRTGGLYLISEELLVSLRDKCE